LRGVGSIATVDSIASPLPARPKRLSRPVPPLSVSTPSVAEEVVIAAPTEN
jgi:hypothetical protein